MGFSLEPARLLHGILAEDERLHFVILIYILYLQCYSLPPNHPFYLSDP
jgi:hypothetical protein